MKLGLGQESTAARVLGGDAPGRGAGIWSEANQRQFQRHWKAFMAAPDWASLRPELARLNAPPA